MQDQNIQDIVYNLCAMATQEAQPYILDYSQDSIATLDLVLLRHKKTIHKENEQEIWQLTSIYGAYLGKTLLLNKLAPYEYHWKINEEDLLVLCSDRRIFSPLPKVYQRLLGAPQSIQEFYNGVIAIIEEGLG